MNIDKNRKFDTPIVCTGEIDGNVLWFKREDMIPYSFGGNKVRKAILFFEEITKGGYDCVVTYGTSHSNHCRIVANMAAMREMKCYIIGPSEVEEDTFNSKFMRLFGAEIVTVPVEQVHETIDNKMLELRASGYKPYFIPGGGHGWLGTEAYVQCYDEIVAYEKKNNVKFDYLFFASGTGTTHSGLVCGQLKNKDDRKIVGISIARKNPRGRDVIVDSIHEYLSEKKLLVPEEMIQQSTEFVDKYVGNGYGREDKEVLEAICDVMRKFGIPLDSTYTGKAFCGMRHYIREKRISGMNILFIHTGGTPLFFDDMIQK